jgi:hypothetical protein
MKGFFNNICLFSKNYVEDIQAIGRDRDFFPQQSRADEKTTAQKETKEIIEKDFLVLCDEDYIEKL